jgi:hypothetical protein
MRHKRKTPKTIDYSPLALRKLHRHSMPPPTVRFRDKKKGQSKSVCREKVQYG